MKKLFLVIGLLVFSNFAQAEDDTCTDISDLAEGVMQARQSGISALHIIKSAEASFGDNIDHLNLIVSMTDAAFDTINYDTEEGKQVAIQEFSSMYFLYCYQNNK